MIGIVGGVGPLAGLDVFKKIIEETVAVKDQEHLPVLLSSQPQRIVDRTNFLVGKEPTNPAYAFLEIIKELDDAGAQIAAIPCNTAHAPAIFDPLRAALNALPLSIRVLHLVEETAKFIQKQYAGHKIGILSTTGTRDTGLYIRILEQHGIESISPDDVLQEKVHQAIYNESYGIKAFSSPVTTQAKEDLTQVVEELKNQGAQVIVLACTELPLALTEKTYFGLPTVDPNRVLARALIQHVAPEKLKPL